jgi:hypothetical protein
LLVVAVGQRILTLVEGAVQVGYSAEVLLWLMGKRIKYKLEEVEMQVLAQTLLVLGVAQMEPTAQTQQHLGLLR